MAMNLERHLTAFRGLYRDLADGNEARAAKTQAFYEEYFTVCDMPAEFYLETVRAIFQDHDLAEGRLQWRGRPVGPAALRRTAQPPGGAAAPPAAGGRPLRRLQRAPLGARGLSRAQALHRRERLGASTRSATASAAWTASR